MKVCATCQSEKPSTEFNRNKSKADGLQTKCRSCQNVYEIEYWAQNVHRRVKQQERIKATRQRNRAWVREYLEAHPCVDCGEKDLAVLDFDHRDPATKRTTIGRLLQGGWSIDTIIAEVAKCDVRCANCHRRRTAVQFGWWSALDQ